MVKLKKNVGIISPGVLEPASIRGGGCEVTDYHVAKELSDLYNVTIFGLFLCNYNNIKKLETINIEDLPFPSINKYPPKSRLQHFIIMLYSMSFHQILLLLKCNKILSNDFIVIHNPQTGFLIFLINKIFKKSKIIFSEGNIYPWYDPLVKKAAMKSSLGNLYKKYNLNLYIKLCNQSDLIRVQSNNIKKAMISNGINENKIFITPAGNSVIKNLILSEPNKNNIGFIGRLSDDKNVSMLIDLCNLLCLISPSISFQIFGDGPLSFKFNKMKNVNLNGFVNHDSLSEAIKDITFFVFFQKELGRAEIECLSQGKIIFVLDYEEITSLLSNGVNAIVCPRSSEQYALKILHTMQLPVNEINNIRLSAIDFSIANNSWEKIGNIWKDQLSILDGCK